MSVKRKIVLFILALSTLFIIFAIWYKYEYSMKIAQEYEVNSTGYIHKLLIATQGSIFKDEVTNGIIDYYKKDSVFIKVTDVTSLAGIDPEDYTAIVVMHTWENWKPPADVELFINRTKENQDKIIVITTSGEGSSKMENIDAITGESILENTSIYINKITERLKPILKP